MINLSEIIGKKVITLYDLHEVGYVSNVLFSPKYKCVKYLVISSNNPDENITFALKVRDTWSIDYYLMIRNDRVLSLMSEMQLEIDGLHNPICDEVTNIKGEKIGVVKDIILNDKYKIESIIVDDKNVSPTDIVDFNRSLMLIKNSEEKKFSLTKFAPKKKIINLNDNLDIVVHAQETPESNVYPTKYIINPEILLGRYITNNIVDSSGIVIARAHQRITMQILEQAKLSGKLRALQENSVQSHNFV